MCECLVRMWPSVSVNGRNGSKGWKATGGVGRGGGQKGEGKLFPDL